MTTQKTARETRWLAIAGSCLLLMAAGCGGGSKDAPAPAVQPSLPPLIITSGALPDGKEGQAYTATLAASGGSGARTWTIVSGTLPESLNLGGNSGVIAGVPSKDGTFTFTVQVTDASSAPNSKQLGIKIDDRSVLGRNDSIVTATKLKTDGNSTVRASLSPYGDPAGGANADTDFFQLTAKSGALITVEIRAKRLSQSNPLDSAFELVDQNGARFITCRDQGDLSGVDGSPDLTPNALDDACLNDDVELGVTQDSKLEFEVPSNLGATVTFYVHVLDWSGSARPDMVYDLNIRGAD